MTLEIIERTFYRVILPGALLFGAVIRPSFISITYVILALLGPLLPPVRVNSPLPGSVRTYYVIVLLISVSGLIAQISYQIYEAVYDLPGELYTHTCNTSASNFWLRQFGLIPIKRDAGFDAFRVILPEILAFLSSLATIVVCTVLSRFISNNNSFEHPSESMQHVRNDASVSSIFQPADNLGPVEALILPLKKLSDAAIVLALGVVGILQPSLLNSIYFLVFLFVLTWWASYKPLQRHVFNSVKLFAIFCSALHFILIYLYQITFFQDVLPGDSFAARLVGFVPIVHTDCNHWWSLTVVKHHWTAFANAFALLIIYHLLIIQYKITRYGVQQDYPYNDTTSSVHEERPTASSSNIGSRDGENPGNHRVKSLLGDVDDDIPAENIPMKKLAMSDIDRQKIAAVFVSPGSKETVTAHVFISVLTFILFHCYAFALLSIMLWALLYHSVFGLIFLVVACFLWVFKNTRTVTFRASPFVLLYTEFLLLSQYVCSMDIKNELHESKTLDSVGFVLASSRTGAFVTLLMKGLLSLSLFALLRLYLREKSYNSLSERERHKRFGVANSDVVDLRGQNGDQDISSTETTVAGKCFTFLSDSLAKYWIFLVSLVLLLISIQSPPVFYTVGYFLFFSVLISFLLVSLECFRHSLFLYWTFLVFYSALVLVVLYIFQFPSIPGIWRNVTGLSKEWNLDIGLINYSEEGDQGALFVRLLAPISFFIVAMLQLKFFHDRWNLLVAPPSRATASTALEPETGEPSIYDKVKRAFQEIMEFLWRFAEVHAAKFVLLLLVVIAVNDICAVNLVFMVFISLAVCAPSISSALSLFLCIFASSFTISRMIFQMHFVVIHPLSIYPESLICNASEYRNAATAYWLGFRKVENIGDHVAGLIVILVVLAFQAIIVYRQRHKQLLTGESKPPRGIVFPAADPKKWDASLLNMVMFFLNYGFYKFGLELSMTMMAIVAWIRMDLIGSLLLLWLIVFTFMSRVACRRLWPLFLLYLAVLFPLQYALYVGLPPSLCIEYPWSSWFSNPLQNDNLVLWLDLGSYRVKLHSHYSIADFFLLLMVACQEYAFRVESTSPAGDNQSIYRNKEYKLLSNNPYYDFVAHQRSFVDFLKFAVFMYGHWATIVMLLIAGLGGVSLFALGYIIIAFIMLWQGNSLYTMRNYSRTIWQWKCVLHYTVIVMFFKVFLQLVACFFIHLLMEYRLCILRQLLSIVCVSTAVGRDSNYYFQQQLDFDNECTVQTTETKIGFDTFAFLFVVLQLRVLNSYYFQHCMLDYRSEAVLVNRGAILKNQLITKEMKEQNAHQQKMFDEIRARTAKIREVYVGQQTEAGAFIPKTYGQAKRAGDYYMFQYDPADDDLEKPVETFVPEVTPGAGDFDELDPAQLIHTVVQRDLDVARTLKAVESAEHIKDDEEERMIRAISASKDDGTEETTEAKSEAEKEKSQSIVLACLRFIKKLALSAVGWSAAFLNRRSREHRYVAYVLGKEKEMLKESLREPLFDVSQPLVEVRDEFEKSDLQCIKCEQDVERLETEVEYNWQQRNVFARFITAAGYCIAAHTDIICYVLAIIDHARNAGLISLPLALLVFLWGTLANPRPSKTFWIVMITYTELCVVIKFLCQFGFFPWNNTAYIIKMSNSIDYVPGILGIRKEEYYAFWDIALLVALFFHRYMLRKSGLWARSNTGTFIDVNSSMNNTTALPIDEYSDPQKDAQAVSECDPTAAEEEKSKHCKRERTLCERFKAFLHRLFSPKFHYIRDLYPFMFLLDVLCFFVVSFGFSSFGYGGSGSVVRDISSNRVPITFVVMLIVISLMIVIDRALYLRKAVKCKLAYQLIIVVFIHIWIFWVLPTITFQAAWLNRTAQFLYFVKGIYLLISAWQIRNGYPTLCAGNLITHAYGLANMIFFKLFMAVPFLFELRTAIDWTWTDTSMPLFDFFNMENFYATIYNLKCARTFESNFPVPRGVPKGIVVKYFMGLPMIILLILVIWLPLLAFSLINRIGIVLLPENVELSISIEGYPPLYAIEAQGIELEYLTENEYNFIQNAFAERFNSSNQASIMRARQAVAFIKEYALEDILKVRFRPESQSPWMISSDALTAMKYELLEGENTVNAIVKLQFERPRSGDSKEPVIHSGTIVIPLPKNSTIRYNLADIIGGNYSAKMTLDNAVPPYVIVPNEGAVKPPASLIAVMHSAYDRVDQTFSNLVMRIQNSTSSNNMVWTVELDRDNITNSLTLPLENVKYETERAEKYVQVVAFVDRVFPTFVTKYVQGGIIAMYIAVVLLVGRLIRGFVTNAPLDVIISEIPNPDHLLKICLDIYLVREAKDFVLEQDLFAKLIFLFRSPATLIKWTRYKVKNE